MRSEALALFVLALLVVSMVFVTSLADRLAGRDYYIDNSRDVEVSICLSLVGCDGQ